MLAKLADPTTIATIVAVAIGLVASSWFSLRKVATREQHRTRRLTEAIKEATPQERPEIIRALSSLEGNKDSEEASAEVPGEPRPEKPPNRTALAVVQQFLHRAGSERGK